jgi:hypothetical protein
MNVSYYLRDLYYNLRYGREILLLAMCSYCKYDVPICYMLLIIYGNFKSKQYILSNKYVVVQIHPLPETAAVCGCRFGPDGLNTHKCIQ